MMKLYYNKIIISAVCLSLGISLVAKPTVVPLERKAETSFAIFTDSKTYEQCSAELSAYKKVLEAEGLGTYIVYSDWNSPDEVKAQILKLSRKRPALEGIVLVGDMPIVMVRGGQHFTTAFKMNEETYPEFESSVPSDRFYDDFDLRFDFIKRDSLRSDVFYYHLSEQGAQAIRPSIYSARMRVPEAMGGDKYEIMRAYLRKVVAAHSSREVNPLDNIKYFAGHGYNSDCLTLWRQKPLVYREYFPYCFSKASDNMFLNFRQEKVMKYNLFSELQRPETDLFQFSEHGDFDTQYISGTAKAESAEDALDMLKRSLARSYRRYKGTAEDEEFCHEVFDSVFNISRSFFTDSLMAVYASKDSVERAEADIFVSDLVKVKSNPRMVIFNACYNGSFHRDDNGYVAGCHVFGDGRCVVAQGNTVNVLQDKWEDKMIGLLSIGERVGMWQKEICFLESHLIGDPTFRFSPHNGEEAALCSQLHHDLVFNEGRSDVWAEYLNSEFPIVRSAGLTHLSYIADPNYSDAVLRIFETDPAMTVRVHALNALSLYKDENMKKAVLRGFDDNYECVVRTACRIAAASGDSLYLPALQTLADRREDLIRVCERLIPNAVNIITNKGADRICSKALDKSLTDVRRIDWLRYMRNDRYPAAAATLLQLVRSDSESEALRVAAAEVLGWYDLSVERENITSSLSDFLKQKNIPSELRKEVVKTLKRLL